MRARRLLAVAGATLALVGFGGAANAAPAPSIKGSGMITLPSEYDDVAGDPVLFQVQTNGAGGRFNVVHLDDAGGLYAHVAGDITCVSIADGVAVTTGIVRQAWFRDFSGSEAVGMAVAITVADSGHNDVIGFDFEFFGSVIDPCEKVEPWIPFDWSTFTIR